MSKVIRLTENQFGEMMAYHGSGSDFDKFNHKKYLNTGAGSQSFGWGTYVTSDAEVAKGYSESVGGTDYVEDYNKWIKNSLDENVPDYLMALKLMEKHKDLFFKNGLSEKDAEKAGHIAWDMLKLAKFNKTLAINLIGKWIKEKRYAYGVIGGKLSKEVEERYAAIYRTALEAVQSLNSTDGIMILYEVEIPDDNGHNYLSWYDTAPYEIYDVLERYLKRYKSHIKKEFLSVNFLEDERAEFTGEDLYRDLEDRFNLYGSNGDKAASLLLMQCGFDGIKYPAGTRWQKPEGAADDAYNYVIFDANKVKIVNKTKV